MIPYGLWDDLCAFLHVAGIVTLPLSIWKLVELITWAANHVHITVR